MGNARLMGGTGLSLGAVEGGKAEPIPRDRNGEATPHHPPVHELIPEPCSGEVFRVRRKQQALQQCKAQGKTRRRWGGWREREEDGVWSSQSLVLV